MVDMVDTDMDTVILDMVMATIEDTAKGLLRLRLNLLLLPNLDTEDTVDMVDTDMDTVIYMARGLLMPRPALFMAMDMAMEAMVMDTALDMATDMVIDMAKGLLMLRPATDMAMDMAMDMVMDTDTMDRRTRQKKFHTENNTKS